MWFIRFIVKMVVGFFLVILLLGVLLSAIGSVKAATFPLIRLTVYSVPI